jgi:hypothetical protein
MLLPVILTIVICCDLIFTVLTQEKYERKLKAQTEDEIKQAKEWENRAMLAVKEGRDDLAKQALIRQQEHAERAVVFQQTWQTQAAETEKLKEKPTYLVASVKLYKFLKDISSNFNAYNNMPSFSALVGDFAPEMELWADPIFYKLYLLPLAHLKDVDKELPKDVKKEVPKKDKKPVPKGKKP